ncbi:hypothetical protein PAPYR_2759 [Paratrimastix pyriformis]|uniref:F-box domain-containing protein n=1 Tax=Paratrimastix pyriformis TaxID=342808 RepID=A0ABQ8UP07_9EUKA|nr:hypothetical protein PAPYR_2759 [Paratrimastix pyriformis]
MFQISNEDGPSLDSLPTEVLQLIYHHHHNGVALSRACLVSRRLKAALWDNDHLWHEAFECDWGRLATTAVELHGTAQKPTEGAQNPQVLNWRSLYAGPLLPLVILPALLVLLILRAEAVIMWSFHLVFIPADFLFLFGCWFFGMFTLQCNSRARPFIISCGVACLAAIPTLHWAAARGDWIAAHGNLMRSADTPGGLNWMGIFTPMLACCIAYTVLISVPIFHYPQNLDISWFLFLLSGLPLTAFLVLLGYKLQWGGPGFLHTYAFIPLFLYPIGLQIGLISALKRNRRMIALTAVVVVMPLAATLILIVLRLDWTVHTAFIVIPTAFWLLPLMVAALALSCSTWSRVRAPMKISVRSLTTLSDAERSAIEEQLTEAFGPHIYRADDERMRLNRAVMHLQREADHRAQATPGDRRPAREHRLARSDAGCHLGRAQGADRQEAAAL